MDQTVTITTVDERPTAVLAATTTWQEFPTLWGRLLDEVHANVRWGGPGRKGRNVMLYRNDIPDVEVGVELDQPVEVGGRVLRSVLPGGAVAMTVHRGPYSGLGPAHARVHEWCAAQGLRLAGPRWEVYGHGDIDPMEIDIFYLLADR
jgi:effector-binding domain-containing protein